MENTYSKNSSVIPGKSRTMIGYFFFILVTLDLSLLLIRRDLWNSQTCQILISVNRD